MNYNVIGLMSGTSLDGLDVAFCRLTPPHPKSLSKREGLFSREKWNYKILAAKTFPYSKDPITIGWKEKLSTVENKSAVELAKLHSEYGHFIGKIVKNFISEFSLSIGEGRSEVFVSSHGHTIFHQPIKSQESGACLPDRQVRSLPTGQAGSETKNKTAFTFQLGNGAAIAAECGLPVVCDFRTTDVALGGQGAPLVPIGDKLLFSDFDFCLNIGGIANISYENISRKGAKTQRVAFDICPANMALNFLAKKTGKEFDKNGEIARKGKINEKLLKDLNSLKYYSLQPPKSLGKEWVVKQFFPILNKHKISVEDKMRTVVEHIALQISSEFRVRSLPTGQAGSETVQSSKTHSRILITGGGAHNKFLIERIKDLPPAPSLKKIGGKMKVVIPDKLTVDFKEALIFALLGVLRWRGENNCLASVTGAKRDNCGGAIYFP